MSVFWDTFHAHNLLIELAVSNTQKGGLTMAMYDWNGNGKNDMVDNFIEYKLSGCDSEDNQENYHYSNNRSSGSGLKVIVIGFFAMVYLFFIFGT